ncbi:uncharacterized protein LOC108857141 [Raphanus sativus]|uniref:Uncharacterized protein LOC108857141 n=1 Tax=Raphanus sativus TaxID=3726 RepID=A0A9W3BTM2_RAPSA|nr:uncharacterized protein LOC108857141 [Raphanus sativus]
MASPAAPLANSAVAYTTFNSLRLGRTVQSVSRLLVGSSATGIPGTSTRMESSWELRFSFSMNWTVLTGPASFGYSASRCVTTDVTGVVRFTC